MDRRIGAQLYTVREFVQDTDGFEKSMKKISDIGYKAVQLSGIGSGISADDIKRILDKYSLIPVCTHRGMDELLNDTENSIEFHKKIGCNIAGLGSMPGIWDGISKEKMQSFVKEMNIINKRFKNAGMTFAYHNHSVEFMKVDGRFIMDYFIEKGEFDFIVDVYWLAYAGINPPDFIKKLGRRAKVIHFKDLKTGIGENHHEMAEIMEGNLDWDKIIAACDEAGSEWAMVEQDICRGDPFDSLKLSYDNLKTKGFE